MTRILKWLSITFVLLIVSMWMVLFFLPLPPLLTGVSYSRSVFDDQDHLLRMTLSHDGKYRLLTPLSEVSPLLVSATLLQEDQYFHWHAGVNPISLAKRAWHTYVTGRRRMGASTITMQVVRLRYHIHSKTISGKLWQIIRALQLETHYSKNQILEAYFNLAPYGNNIEGVGAASYIYFGKPAQALNLPEALTLTVIPQNPTQRVPNQSQLKEIRNKLYVRWLKQHAEDLNKKSLMDLPLQIRSLHAAPFFAPHFVNNVLHNTSIIGDRLKSTLDVKLQAIIERVTHQYILRKTNLGVNNAAVLLVDSRDMSIKAMLGSADFFNHGIGGQINGTEIKRSPGSTLKPFIYALAIDQGLIHPKTILKDVPHRFGNYNPENFDNDFVGPIKAKDALILSRNIPAIYLADQLKHPSLYEFLQQAYVRDLKSESYYGLALVLGGAELTMQELVTLYAALANEGLWQPLRFMKNQHTEISQRLLSPEASFLVLDMLKETSPPNDESLSQQLEVSWKTGTSSGYRDAWTIGVVGPYVLGIWIGNFDNQGNPVFIGKEMAAPLFFDIIHAIYTQGLLPPSLPHHPEQLHLTQVEVCKASGMLPTRFCPDKEKVWFIPGKSPIKTDTIYREIAINSKTGLRACQFDQTTRFQVFEFWSSDLLNIFKRAGIERRIPPPYDSSCTMSAKTNEGFAPQIISPETQVNYVVRIATAKESLVPFNAVVDADVKNLYWFVNATFVGKTSREKSFFWQAKPGNYVVRVVDDHGRSDVREMRVVIDN